jgi:hypothetical protein
VLLAAVADGAGSAPLAEVGASQAVGAAIKALSLGLQPLLSATEVDDPSWCKLLVEAVVKARAGLEEEAKTRSVPLSDLATTLILAIAGPNFVASVQIGDGAVVGALPGETLVCIGRPPASEYLNETTFLTSDSALEDAKLVVWRGELAGIAVFSDGLQMAGLRMPGAEPHPGFFLPLFRFAQGHQDELEVNAALVSFLESPRLRERTHDDVTLVLATRS